MQLFHSGKWLPWCQELSRTIWTALKECQESRCGMTTVTQRPWFTQIEVRNFGHVFITTQYQFFQQGKKKCQCQQDPKSYYFPKIQRRYISFFSSCSLNLRVKANVMLQPGLSFQVTCKVKTRVCFGAAGRWKSHGTWGGWGGEGGCIKLKVELLEDEIGSWKESWGMGQFS